MISGASAGQARYPARDRPVVAALDPMFISGQSWASLIRSGHLDFVILPRIRVNESLPERSPEQRFEKRFHLITRENLDTAVREYLEL